MSTPEARARTQIDELLTAAGWLVQDRAQMRLLAGPGVAVREFPLSSGFADYMLFVNGKAIGIVSPANGRQAMERDAYGLGKPGLSLENLREHAIPLPPLAEQRRIIAEVERRLSVVAEVEATVAASLKRAERLRQAVLKRAFEGRLVPQDPSDASAEALLSTATLRDRQVESTTPNGAETSAAAAPRRGRGRPPQARQERLEGM